MPITTATSTEEASSETTSTTEITEEEEEENLPDVTLVVEDGSGVADSNSYCDLDFAIEYCVMKGYTAFTQLDEDKQKIHLIRGTEFVDNFYQWFGRRKYPATQALSFPRVNLTFEGARIEGIPVQLKKACIEAAVLSSKSSATTLFSQKDSNGQVKRKKVDTLEKEYFESTSSSSEVDYTTIYDILNKLLKGFYRTGEEKSGANIRAMWMF